MDSNSISQIDMTTVENQHAICCDQETSVVGTFKQGDSNTCEKPSNERIEQPQQSSQPPNPKLFIIIAALCLGTLLDAIDITIIGVAVPMISTSFDALDDVGWYGSAYLICLTALQPIFGVTYKFFNPKRTYVYSMLLFEAGSVLSASAPNSTIFVLGRAICGCGGAGILQGALCIVALSVPLEKRALYLAR